MSVYVDRHNWDWKPVPGNVKKKPQACPRCNNQVQYFLAYDGDGWGFPGIWTFKLKQHYAFNRLLKYYPYGRTCSAAASAFVAAVSVF